MKNTCLSKEDRQIFYLNVLSGNTLKKIKLCWRLKTVSVISYFFCCVSVDDYNMYIYVLFSMYCSFSYVGVQKTFLEYILYKFIYLKFFQNLHILLWSHA